MMLSIARKTIGKKLDRISQGAAPSVRLLITSREVLNLREELLYPVQNLPYPDDSNDTGDITGFSTIQLFVERARRVRPDFSLVDEQSSVARICRLVEGLPLAIELAASWTRTSPGTLIGDEIERNLDLLTTSLRNMPERHRRMQAVFDHSWLQLGQEEQTVSPILPFTNFTRLWLRIAGLTLLSRYLRRYYPLCRG
jgi:predicted ATPase